MLAASRIILDVAQYRLSRLEMANIASVVAIAASLHLGVTELLGRVLFAALLNLLVYLNNDFHDLDADMGSASRASDKTRFLSKHRADALGAQLALLALLLGFALAWRPALLVPLMVGGGVCWLYSARLKRRAGFDVAAMVVWGAAMAMVGMPLDSAAGWALIGQLALFSGCFESIQVLRDHDEDARLGVRTSAVALGPARTLGLIRIMIAASAIYAALVFHPLLAAFPAAAMSLSVDTQRVDRYWNFVRILLGLAFVGECVFVYTGRL